VTGISLPYAMRTFGDRGTAFYGSRKIHAVACLGGHSTAGRSLAVAIAISGDGTISRINRHRRDAGLKALLKTLSGPAFRNTRQSWANQESHASECRRVLSYVHFLRPRGPRTAPAMAPGLLKTPRPGRCLMDRRNPSFTMAMPPRAPDGSARSKHPSPSVDRQTCGSSHAPAR
jgi:hypothetical protein